MTAPQRPHSRGRDIGWMAVVVLMALFGVANVVGGLYGLFTGRFRLAVGAVP